MNRQSLVPFDPLFPDQAAHGLAVFKSLQMVGVPRATPKTKDDQRSWATFGEACDQFVFDFVQAIFGAYDAKSGNRLINEFLLLISKKNAKSTIAAGIMVTALIINWRHEAELTILAPTQKVAGNSFRPASAMVRADPKLGALLRVIDNVRTIRHLVTNAELKVIAADTNTAGGSQSGFVLVDELWLFGKRANAADMLEEATGGLASRPEGFVVYLTTHSNEPPAGVFKEKLEYFRDVRDGRIADPQSFGMLYEWPEAMIEAGAYLKPENFYVTNPHLGRSVSQQFIERKLRRAANGEEEVDEESGEAETFQVVLAKYLNVEIGLRLRRDRWRGADYWEAAGDPTLTLEALLDRCEVAVVGADGGGLDDLYGLCVAGREKATSRWLYWCKAWAWPDVLKRRKQIVALLRDFEAQGDLVLCQDLPLAETEDSEGNDFAVPQDIRDIVDIIEQVRASGKMPDSRCIGLDACGVSFLVDELAKVDFVANEAPWHVIPVGQGFRLQPAIVGLARKLKHGGVVHSASPMMAWCVSNAKEEQGRQSVMIVKSSAGSAKIDPFMAMLNATMLLIENPVAGQAEGSVYSEREMLVI
ncbi:terminase large subunit [Sphingomonas sp. OTU376]|uniref:terminase large subunit n=1 Tax=Sphingomonas sp. OTU376 TaxID=3043863 RepID=UPI00313EE809